MDLFVLQRSPQCALTISSLLRMTAQSTSTLSSEVISQQTRHQIKYYKAQIILQGNTMSSRFRCSQITKIMDKSRRGTNIFLDIQTV